MYPDSGTRLAGQRREIVGSTSTDTSGFFSGSSGPTFKDVLDTINPLQHIPIVSGIYEKLTGDVASPAAKLAGGALLGGPIGFMTSMFDVIFQQQTGHSMGGALVASLDGDSSTATTQVASAADTESDAGTAIPAASGTTDAAAPVTPVQSAPVQKVSSAATSQKVAMNDSGDQAVLSLFGTQAASAHASYQKAQLLPYLKDVNNSAVM